VAAVVEGIRLSAQRCCCCCCCCKEAAWSFSTQVNERLWSVAPEATPDLQHIPPSGCISAKLSLTTTLALPEPHSPTGDGGLPRLTHPDDIHFSPRHALTRQEQLTHKMEAHLQQPTKITGWEAAAPSGTHTDRRPINRCILGRCSSSSAAGQSLSLILVGGGGGAPAPLPYAPP
jgi:hypothetical protein